MSFCTLLAYQFKCHGTDSCLGQEVGLDSLLLGGSEKRTVIMVSVQNLQNNFKYNSSSLKVEVLQIRNDPFSLKSLRFYVSTLLSTFPAELTIFNPSNVFCLKVHFAINSTTSASFQLIFVQDTFTHLFIFKLFPHYF